MNKIQGRTFVLTGKMYTERDMLEDAIVKLGGYVSNNVSSDTSYLVQACGEWGRSTGKLSDARRYYVPVIDDKDLYAMIVDANDHEAGNVQP